MGMSVGAGGGGGGRRRRGGRRAAPVNEINITPFVDVMLVLLIIFMVAAPLMTSGVPVDLPQTAAKPLQGDNEPITISVTADGKIFIQNTEIALDEVVPKLSAIAENGYEERIFVKGDQTAAYGTMMQIMGRINAAGFKRLGLVTLAE
ncbi:protein TolR [Pannonibacter indicus]|uniref:Cell division and transport-associated protein TolR (TC 2.C.1.2.1) n=1 Tax=Pannonibacter indicus TaxID=466044 RepID=A0A0K6I663_9HYPH|nr:protein TolR [Pannonibacter indicus]CUA98615.1 Cell division and transport-associated protein TolR (TC 2.C.1.2.1) [Pannonibacter indicus]